MGTQETEAGRRVGNTAFHSSASHTLTRMIDLAKQRSRTGTSTSGKQQHRASTNTSAAPSPSDWLSLGPSLVLSHAVSRT